MNTYLDDWKIERIKLVAMQERERELARVEAERIERDRARAEAAETEAKKSKPAPKPQPAKPSPRPDPRYSYRKELASALAEIGLSAAEIEADLNEREAYMRRHVMQRKRETCGTGLGNEASTSDVALACSILGHSRETALDLKFLPKLACAASIIQHRPGSETVADAEFVARIYALADVPNTYALTDRAASALRGLV